MRYLAVLIALTGCEPLPATGNPLQPVPPAPKETAGEPGASTGVPEANAGVEQGQDDAATSAGDGFDFDADGTDGSQEAEEGTPDAADAVEDDPVALLAKQQGEEVETEPAEPEPPPAEEADKPVYAWDPETAPAATWGIRLLSTVNTMMPPRAVIGLPDGSEQVVQPGAMLPELQLVIMAVGDSVIEVAHVEPAGVQAKVETRVVEALFPQP